MHPDMHIFGLGRKRESTGRMCKLHTDSRMKVESNPGPWCCEAPCCPWMGQVAEFCSYGLMEVLTCGYISWIHTCSSVTASEVRSIFLGVNPMKATGPDSFPGRALRSCADQMPEVFTSIFSLSLLQAQVPICFKKTTIIPIPKKPHAVCLNDYCPVVLTSIIIKCFNKLVMAHINSNFPTCLDPLLKTKELIIDFRKKGREHALIYINGTQVERVESAKFLR
eukprot:g28141.t1